MLRYRALNELVRVKIDILLKQESDHLESDEFVYSHSHGSLYNLTAWKKVVTRSYMHEIYSLIAMGQPDSDGNLNIGQNKIRYSIAGLLHLVHMRHRLFGNRLVSMPFCDAGGMLSINENVERMMIKQALRSADVLHIPALELRQYQPLICLSSEAQASDRIREIKMALDWRVSVAPDTNKARMLLDLSESLGDPDMLMKRFKPKLRSQIRKPVKEGLIIKNGGIELIDDFYNIFAENMRDLGSPVHSKKFIIEVLKAFSSSANIFVVYSNKKPLASSIAIGFKDILYNPWASSLRRYSHLAPNMLLYWSMLEFACQNNYRCFDFGRSTPNEGAYRFKEQWGAKPKPLYWYHFFKADSQYLGDGSSKDKMSKAIEYWKKLPIPVTKIIGPRIRKYISL